MATEFDLDLLGGTRALSSLIDVVTDAGEEALRLQRGIGVLKKDDESPVTAADQEVERRLRAHIDATWPEAAILGEEGGEKSGTKMRFILDPIDGTRAFIRGLPTWSVLLAMEWEGQLALAIALMPTDGDLFVARAGGGATMNGRPCRVSNVDSMGDALVGVGGAGQFTDSGRGPALLKIAETAYSTRSFADFANYRALLQGRMDGVVDPGIKCWDIAPAALLVSEAGGHWTDLEGGRDLHYGGFVASNGKIHDGLLETLK